MTYATLDHLKKNFGIKELIALTDRQQNNSIDEAVVARALDDASAEIDIYLLKRYSLPLQQSFPILTMLAADIARFRLHATDPSDEVRKRYEEAKELLERIANGTYSLNDDHKHGRDTNSAQLKASPRQFNDKNLSSF